ncbi:MAG: hypothetical protein ABI898_00190 [Sphingomonadales bacterium]
MTTDPYSMIEERRPRPLRNALVIALVAFVLGVALVTWAFTRWEPARRMILPAATTQATTVQGVVAQPMTTTPLPIATAGDVSSEVAITESRVAGLEARLAQIDTRADAASANAARAEGLLIAFAARRAVERGGSLGYLEVQLRTRFADTQPRAVAAIITATQSPVTLNGLRQQLDRLEPQLVGDPAGERWDAAITRAIGSLFVVRKADAPSPAADQRFERARVSLDGGQVDAALTEVARLPGRAAATDWMAAARRYIEAQRALDILEAAALTAAPLTIAGPVQ